MSGGGVHGLFDETNQTRGAAAGDQGALHRRASVIERGKQPDGPILVRAKSKFADRIPAYLQNCRQNVIVMLDALDRVDFETVTSLGHQMRGSGGIFGFQAITDIGAAIELAAESADTDASRKWVGELSSYLEGVETPQQPARQ